MISILFVLSFVTIIFLIVPWSKWRPLDMTLQNQDKIPSFPPPSNPSKRKYNENALLAEMEGFLNQGRYIMTKSDLIKGALDDEQTVQACIQRLSDEAKLRILQEISSARPNDKVVRIFEYPREYGSYVAFTWPPRVPAWESKKVYIDLSKKTCWLRNHDLFYECTLCGTSVWSMDETICRCTCGNFSMDPGACRMGAKDESVLRLYRIVEDVNGEEVSMPGKDKIRSAAVCIWIEWSGRIPYDDVVKKTQIQCPDLSANDIREIPSMFQDAYERYADYCFKKKSLQEAFAQLVEKYPWLTDYAAYRLWDYGGWLLAKG